MIDPLACDGPAGHGTPCSVPRVEERHMPYFTPDVARAIAADRRRVAAERLVPRAARAGARRPRRRNARDDRNDG
jgi:hypothetical protein